MLAFIHFMARLWCTEASKEVGPMRLVAPAILGIRLTKKYWGGTGRRLAHEVPFLAGVTECTRDRLSTLTPISSARHCWECW